MSNAEQLAIPHVDKVRQHALDGAVEKDTNSVYCSLVFLRVRRKYSQYSCAFFTTAIMLVAQERSSSVSYPGTKKNAFPDWGCSLNTTLLVLSFPSEISLAMIANFIVMVEWVAAYKCIDEMVYSNMYTLYLQRFSF